MITRIKRMNPVKAAQCLFLLNAAIWLLFGVISLARMASNSGQAIAALAVAFLMLANVAAMAVAGIVLARQNSWIYFFSLGVLLVNIVLTFTDQFGVFDFITLLLDALLLGLLIGTRSHYRMLRMRQKVGDF